jgi:hypothetical protein
MSKKYTNLFWYLVISLIAAGISYTSIFEKNAKFSQEISQFGGYKADGNFTYCQKLESFTKQACLEDKSPNFGLKYPLFMKIIVFGTYPLIAIFFWYHNEYKN